MARLLVSIGFVCAGAAQAGDFPQILGTLSRRSRNVDLNEARSQPVASQSQGEAAPAGSSSYQRYASGYAERFQDVAQYGDYSKYMHGFPQGPPADVQGAPNANTQADTIAKADGDYVDAPKHTTSSQAWRKAFVQRFADAYKQYIDAGDNAVKDFPHAPASAEDCHTLKELNEWRSAQTAMRQKYVPSQYQAFAAGVAREEYAKNKARIEAEAPEDLLASPAAAHVATGKASPVLLAAEPGRRSPTAGRRPEDYIKAYASTHVPASHRASDPKAWRDVFLKEYAEGYADFLNFTEGLQEHSGVPARAADCTSMHQLREWRELQRSRVSAYIPEAYRSFAAGAVEQEYADKARLVKRDYEKKFQAVEAPAVRKAAEKSPEERGDRRRAEKKTDDEPVARKVAPSHELVAAAARAPAANQKAPPAVALAETAGRPQGGESLDAAKSVTTAPTAAAAVAVSTPVALMLGGCAVAGFAAAALLVGARAWGARRHSVDGTEYFLVVA